MSWASPVSGARTGNALTAAGNAARTRATPATTSHRRHLSRRTTVTRNTMPREPVRLRPAVRAGATFAVPAEGAGGPASVRGRLVHRQPHLEAGVAGLRRDADVAAMAIDHDPVRDVQAQPGALADRLRGEERLEDPLPQLGRDARPGVTDLDEYPVAIAGGTQGAGTLAVHLL